MIPFINMNPIMALFPCLVLAGRIIGMLNLTDVFYYISVVVMHIFSLLMHIRMNKYGRGSATKKGLGARGLDVKICRAVWVKWSSHDWFSGRQYIGGQRSKPLPTADPMKYIVHCIQYYGCMAHCALQRWSSTTRISCAISGSATPQIWPPTPLATHRTAKNLRYCPGPLLGNTLI